MTAPRIDSHQHFWELGRFAYEWLDDPVLAPIRRSYLPVDLQPLLRRTGIDCSVFVQTQHQEMETDWVLGLAEEFDFIAGVVGWADLTGPHLAETLARWLEHPKFVGIRHVTHDEPDDDFIVRPDVLCGLQTLERCGVPFDLLFYVKHLRHVPTLARACPNLPLVIDHLAKPNVRDNSVEFWESGLRQAASYPNVYCKISGLVTQADWHNWTVDNLKLYVMLALDAFGPARCMFGSDWPVCELAAPYEDVIGCIETLTSDLSLSERDEIFGLTALRFYHRLKCVP